MKKRAVVACAVGLLIAALCLGAGRLVDSRAESVRRAVFSYVRGDNVFLDEYIRNGRSDGITVVDGRQSTPVYEGDCAVFLCRAIGPGPDGTYYGFYYAPDDSPRNTWTGHALRDAGAGYRWTWAIVITIPSAYCRSIITTSTPIKPRLRGTEAMEPL